MVKPDLDSGSLVQVSERITSGISNYYLLSTKSTGPQVTSQVQAFRDWAMAEREKS